MFKKQKIKNYLLLFVSCFAVILLVFHFPFLASLSPFPISIFAQTQKPEIMLAWSTNSYIPLDYPAKALPAKGSLIEIVAFLESSSPNPETLYYYWYLDERLQRNKSGLRKQVFKFLATNEAGRSHQVKLWLKSKEDSSILEKTIEIKIVAPQVYIKGPTLIMAEQEKQFTARPYFFNIKKLNELNYQWSFGGKEALIVDIKNPSLLALKIGQIAKTTTQNLKVAAENKNNPGQKAETELKITLMP